MAIRRLPPLLVNQIAAGEVIERPASVVKELVENSLDAGAGRIEVAIEEGGRNLIRVADDGRGMTAEDLPLAVTSHATSKLADAAGLEAIATLGFRGEALASIASVSRLTIRSRPRPQDGESADGSVGDARGHELRIAGDEVVGPTPVGCGPGTVIEMRDLFFNTPARRKFLRTAATEVGHIHDTLKRLAMVHPDVGFVLVNNGRETLRLDPRDNDPGGRYRRCVDVLGAEVEEGLLMFEGEVDSAERGKRVWGLAGLPVLARANGRALYLCVNGRPVRDRALQHAAKEAYRGLMPADRQPMAVVFLELDPREVDVNVHPAKAEVRFREASSVHGLVHSSIRRRLLGADLTPGFSAGGDEDRVKSGDLKQHSAAGNNTASLARDLLSPTGGLSAEPGSGVGDGFGPGEAGNGQAAGVRAAGPGSDDQATRAFVDFFRRMDPRQKGFAFREVRDALASGLRSQPILQVRSSYVVTEDEDGLLIVDQHALHERVMFEEIWRRLGAGRRLESQRLLLPVHLRAPADRQATLERLGPLLDRIGISWEPTGPASVAVTAFPSLLFDRGVEPTGFVEELIDRAEAGDIDADAFDPAGAGEEARSAAAEAALHAVVDMMACKAAVKAGDRLSEAELADLLAKRETVERSSSCPHGRPTSLRLSLQDLERRFGRS